MRSNTYLIASVFYTVYGHYLLILSLILLVAMIGVIVLTLDVKNKYIDNNLYQDYFFDDTNYILIGK